jgi:hypothetical protein
VLGGVAGSLVHTITIFSSRVGRDTLEASFLWWYLLRPFAAALLALLFVAAVQSGLVAVGGKPESLVLALVAGGLAGLFTDAVLQKLRGLLGATSTKSPLPPGSGTGRGRGAAGARRERSPTGLTPQAASRSGSSSECTTTREETARVRQT